MKTRLCDINVVAVEKLPQFTDDKSGIGVHYADAYIKPMNKKLEDGTPVRCKRRGLKIAFSVGARKGEGLMRRLAVGPDPAVMLQAALQEAAQSAGVAITMEDGAIFIDTPDS
jgi:electron transfer flavoprotein alpha/beta subunit